VDVSASTSPVPGVTRLTFGVYGGGATDYQSSVKVLSGSSHGVVVVTDPAKHLIDVTLGGRSVFARAQLVGAPIVATTGESRSAGVPPAVSVVNETVASTTLCRSLIRR
jgi:hypothetical protein